MKQNYSLRRPALVCLCVIALLAATITCYAAGAQVFGWAGNMEIDDTGVTLHTDNLTEPIIYENGRMIFIADHQHTDITDLVSTTQAYHYQYTDQEGYIHHLLVGLNTTEAGNFGYAEYIGTSDGQWEGGYSARVNIEPDGSTVPWLDNAKAELNIPW